MASIPQIAEPSVVNFLVGRIPSPRQGANREECDRTGSDCFREPSPLSETITVMDAAQDHNPVQEELARKLLETTPQTYLETASKGPAAVSNSASALSALTKVIQQTHLPAEGTGLLAAGKSESVLSALAKVSEQTYLGAAGTGLLAAGKSESVLSPRAKAGLDLLTASSFTGLLTPCLTEINKSSALATLRAASSVAESLNPSTLRKLNDTTAQIASIFAKHLNPPSMLKYTNLAALSRGIQAAAHPLPESLRSTLIFGESLHGVAKAWSPPTTTRLHGFGQAANNLASELGLDAEFDPTEVDFVPTDDDRVFELLVEHAPELAETIEAAAKTVSTPFWARRYVRNALACFVVSIVITAYGVGIILPSFWGAVVFALLAATELGGIPTLYRRIAPPPADEEPTSTPPAAG